jgi:hypothetical protein
MNRRSFLSASGRSVAGAAPAGLAVSAVRPGSGWFGRQSGGGIVDNKMYGRQFDDPEANKLLKPPCRKGYEVRDEVRRGTVASDGPLVCW